MAKGFVAAALNRVDPRQQHLTLPLRRGWFGSPANEACFSGCENAARLVRVTGLTHGHRHQRSQKGIAKLLGRSDGLAVKLCQAAPAATQDVDPARRISRRAKVEKLALGELHCLDHVEGPGIVSPCQRRHRRKHLGEVRLDGIEMAESQQGEDEVVDEHLAPVRGQAIVGLDGDLQRLCPIAIRIRDQHRRIAGQLTRADFCQPLPLSLGFVEPALLEQENQAVQNGRRPQRLELHDARVDAELLGRPGNGVDQIAKPIEGLDVVGIEFDRPSERGLRARAVIQSEAERGMAGGQVRGKRDRAPRIFLLPPGVPGNLAGRRHADRRRQGRPAGREIWIGGHDLSELLDGFGIARSVTAADLGSSVAVQRIDLAGGGDVLGATAARARQPPADPSLDFPSDLGLESENIVQLAIKRLAPDLGAVARAGQVGANPHPIARLSNARLNQIVSSLSGRTAAFLGQFLGRIRPQDEQLRVARQCLARVFPNAQSKAVVDTADGGEGKDGDGWSARIAAAEATEKINRCAGEKEQQSSQSQRHAPVEALTTGARFARRLGWPFARGDRGHACEQLLPTAVLRVAAPASQIRALDLIERKRRKSLVQFCLDELGAGSCEVRLCSDPLRLGGMVRPEHHHDIGAAEPLLYDLAVGAVGGELVIAPSFEALLLQLSLDVACDSLVPPRVTDKDLGQAQLQKAFTVYITRC